MAFSTFFYFVEMCFGCCCQQSTVMCVSNSFLVRCSKPRSNAHACASTAPTAPTIDQRPAASGLRLAFSPARLLLRWLDFVDSSATLWSCSAWPLLLSGPSLARTHNPHFRPTRVCIHTHTHSQRALLFLTFCCFSKHLPTTNFFRISYNIRLACFLLACACVQVYALAMAMNMPIQKNLLLRAVNYRATLAPTSTSTSTRSAQLHLAF